MGAQLKTTVFVADPDTHQTVELDPGALPEPRLAALVTNPAAWVDGKLPRLRAASKSETGKDPEGDGLVPSGDSSGDGSDTGSGDGDTDPDEPPGDAHSEEGAAAAEEPKPAARAAKKTAARKPAATAAEGTGGQ
ncbi:hypothetical protein [Streptomyces sp. NPDC047981]|uniref:hypothetical protein n=1 Tax=Streptomyces sp. NPDC047981 TaxID=3154610 RepID=UPI00343BFD4E